MKYNVTIVGSGIAGLSCAAYLQKKGFSVVLLTKADKIEETNTFYAQGGIISEVEEDTPNLLAKDILYAGANYNNIEAVDYFSKNGPSLVPQFLMDAVGVDFSKNKAGNLDYTEEGAHSVRRIAHYHDYTGEAIEKSLVEYVTGLGVKILTNHVAIDLISNTHHSKNTQEIYKPQMIMGVYALNSESNEVVKILSDKVVLATGGVGNLFQYTSNPSEATGDGICMAAKANAEIINAEFIQFHPTLLFHKDNRRFLISESLRGEGAKLIDSIGNPFMKNYDTEEDLAARDIVSRAIFDMMAKKNQEYVELDIHKYYKGEEPIQERFSKIYETCLKSGIDISKEPIPVVPAAHYFCGGIKVDLNGRSSVNNLYAIGEVSCTGLHGANRLASTSLLEALLWAKSTADDIANNFEEIKNNRLSEIPEWKGTKTKHEPDPILVKQDWKTIKTTMWNYVGIIRTKKGLERATADLNYYYRRIMQFYKKAPLNKDIIELRNAVVCASIISNAALRNTKSVGCHFRKK